MKKLSILLITAVLGSVAYAAGTSMNQDERGPDSRPARTAPANRRTPNPEPFLGGDDNGPVLEGRRPNGRVPQGQSPLDTTNRADGFGGTTIFRSPPGSQFDQVTITDNYSEQRYVRPRHVTRTVVETHMEPLSKEEIAEQKKLAEATRLLHSSKDEAERNKAADTIREQLNAQFDRDLKRREKELADIEARLKTLREQVEKRKAARDRIVGLKLDTILNEADGLGFPGESVRPAGPDPFGVGYRAPGFLEPARVDDLAAPGFFPTRDNADDRDAADAAPLEDMPPASKDDTPPSDLDPLLEERPVETTEPPASAGNPGPEL